MTGFFEIFQPGLRYKREQDDLEKVLIVEADKGGSGPRPLDLDSGSVLLRMPGGQVTETSEATDRSDGAEASTTAP